MLPRFQLARECAAVTAPRSRIRALLLLLLGLSAGTGTIHGGELQEEPSNVKAREGVVII